MKTYRIQTRIESASTHGYSAYEYARDISAEANRKIGDAGYSTDLRSVERELEAIGPALVESYQLYVDCSDFVENE